MAVLSHKVFIDSSLLLAFIDRGNLNHLKAVALLEFLGKNSYRVYTSSLVTFQTFNRLESDVSSTVAREFLKAILESDIETLYPTQSEMLAAFRFLKLNPQKRASLTEVVNASLMEKNGINTILTFDFWNNLLGIKLSPLLSS